MNWRVPVGQVVRIPATVVVGERGAGWPDREAVVLGYGRDGDGACVLLEVREEILLTIDEQALPEWLVERETPR